MSTHTGPASGGTAITITGTDFDGATTVDFYLGTTFQTAVNANNVTGSSLDITTNAFGSLAGSGPYVLVVNATSGSSSTTATSNNQFTYTSVLPSITSMTVTSGPVGTGTQTVITGTNLNVNPPAGSTSVDFLNFGTGTIVSNTGTQLTVTTPTGGAPAGGPSAVTVNNGYGTSNSLTFNFTSILPTVTGIRIGASGPYSTSASGPNTGGTTVFLEGTNFIVGGQNVVSSVIINGMGSVAPANITVIDANHLSFTTPNIGSTTPAPAVVQVATTHGTSSVTGPVQFTYFAAPTISSVSLPNGNPANGPATGGTQVVINGANFNGTGAGKVTKVLFGTTPATSFTVNSASKITALAPPGTGIVDIRVVTQDGTTTPISAADQYTYYTSKNITLTVKVPQAIVSQGVYLQIFGTVGKDASTNRPYKGIQPGTGIYFKYSSTKNNAGDFVAGPASSTFTTTHKLVFGAVDGDGNQTATISVPNLYYLAGAGIDGGEMVLSIGGAPKISTNSSGVGGAPSPAVAGNIIFGLAEFALVGAGSAANLDLDLSYVDQIGFPFTVNSTPTSSFPTNGGVGTTLDRQTLFDQYKTYIAGQGATAADFAELATVNAGVRILAPQDILAQVELSPPAAPTVKGTKVTGNSLTAPPAPAGSASGYYYVITAVSPTGGETEVSAQNSLQIPTNGTINTAVLTWTAFPNAVGYYVYRGIVTFPKTGSPVYDSTLFKLHTTPLKTLGYTDTGKTSGTAATPPTDNFGYDPLSKYFDTALDTFFSTYAGTDSFTIHRDGAVFTGNTKSNFDYAAPDGNTYHYDGQALVLKSDSYDYVILDPRFSTNGYAGNAAPPDWLVNTSMSPGQMIFAAAGAMGDGGEPGTVPATGSGAANVLKDLQNSIATAFNRGIASTVAPDNWANPPVNFVATTPGTGSGSLPASPTYYVITGVTAAGETTASIEQVVTPTNGSVNLTWSTLPQQNFVTAFDSFNIYRGSSTGGENTLVWNVPGTQSTYTDKGTFQGLQTPPMYNAPGSYANWYAAFLHQSTVSINGLAYGYAYDDQGGFSSNFSINNPQAVAIQLYPWNSGLAATQDSLVFKSEARSQLVGDPITRDIVVLSANGTPVFGSNLQVTVTVTGPKGTTVTKVPVSYLTGVATYTMPALPAGNYTVTYSLGTLELTDQFTILPALSLSQLDLRSRYR